MKNYAYNEHRIISGEIIPIRKWFSNFHEEKGFSTEAKKIETDLLKFGYKYINLNTN